jgi:hypothetical protein
MVSLVFAILAAAAPAAADGKAAFERLKSLAGEWHGAVTTETGPPAAVRYEVGSNGTIVRELLFPGTEHEMMSVYHLAGGELVLTHYCAMGNQPRMRLKAATAEELVFDFDGGTNVAPERDAHIHSGRIAFTGPDRVYAEWDVFDGGRRSGTHKLFMSRKK